MALSRPQKEAQVAELSDKMKKALSVIFIHYIGLTVSDISKLRGNLRDGEAEMQVAKKSLIQLAAKDASAPDITDEMLPGPVACVFSFKEPTSGAALSHAFGKDHPQVKLVGGIFSGKILSESEANEMATIPPKPQLIAMFMSMCNAPLTQFASAVGSPLTGFARALSEIAKKKESDAPVPVAEAAPPAPETPPDVTAESAQAEAPAA